MPAADNKLKQDVKDRIISETADGSKTLYMPSIDEHYHSVKGALTESMHIFIDCGLRHSAAQSPHILEIGFGTGLNALLTLEEAERTGRTMHYTGIERYPLSWEEVAPLHYSTHPLFKAMHRAPWEADVPLTPRFTLHKMQLDAHLLGRQSLPPVHVVYFDAFAPEKQPAMWTPELFERLYQCLDEGGILTTYCAKGIVRRMLQGAGFTVERLPGPPNGKREILRATK